MRNIFTLLLLAAIAGLTSCGNGGVKITNLIAIPAGDTSSKGSYLDITFYNGDTLMNTFSTYKMLSAGYFPVSGTDSEVFTAYDLTVNNSPIYTLTSSTVLNANDSFYTGKLELVDRTTRLLAINLTVYRDSNSATGNYWINVNNSTVTDYSLGTNRIYQVGPGSVVNFAQVNSLYNAGTFNLNLLSNYQIIPAFGFFKIYK